MSGNPSGSEYCGVGVQLTYHICTAQHPHEVFLTASLEEEVNLMAVLSKVVLVHESRSCCLADRHERDPCGLPVYYCIYRLHRGLLTPHAED